MRSRQALHVLAGITLALIFMTAILTGTSFLLPVMFERVGQHPSALLAQVVSTLLGVFVCMVIISGAGFATRGKQRTFQASIFGDIFEAMRRIAQGDFSVRLDPSTHDHGLASELTRSVNDMALELSRIENMRQEFISNVSHELQSPLTSIRGFAEALQDDTLASDTRHHYLTIIETESTRLSRLTDNLLRLASLRSTECNLNPTCYRLDRQIRHVILACEPQWASKSIDLDVCLDDMTIAADASLLSQVWINLIQNSLKFTSDGGHVRIGLARRGPTVEFTIADTGIGIAEEDRVHVFERFYKADRARSRSLDGSGLGLAIAKEIVDMHHGSIEVDSTLGAGTTFLVRLPVAFE